MPKTILIATDNFMPRTDGIARFLEMFIQELQGYNVVVIAPDFQGTFEKKGNYTIHRVPLRKFAVGDYHVPQKPKGIVDIVKAADLVFTQTIGPIGTAIINEAYKQEKKIISFVHSIEWILVEKCLPVFNLTRSILSLIAKLHAKGMYNKCTSIIVPSADVGEIFSLQGIKRPKYVVHLGIDVERFSPVFKEKAKEALGLDKNDFIVGYLGRLAREKSIPTLLRAFRNIEAKNKKLLVVGDGLPSLEAKLKSPRIVHIKKTTDVVPYLNAMDVMVMPSLIETTCLAALEAMSCETPVISTKVGNMREYIKNDKNGLFFPKKNHIVLGIRLNYLYANLMHARVLGKAARRTVVNEYNWEKTKKDLLKIIELHTT